MSATLRCFTAWRHELSATEEIITRRLGDFNLPKRRQRKLTLDAVGGTQVRPKKRIITEGSC